MPQRRDHDPIPGFRFLIEYGQEARAYFGECTGLKTEIEVFEYQEGGENDFVHKLPGRRKWSNIVLKRGLMLSEDLWKWYLKVVAGQTGMRRNISIILIDETVQSGIRWEVTDAFPLRWEGPALKAASSTIPIETLEIAHEGITIENG